jgi:hypothetical protein
MIRRTSVLLLLTGAAAFAGLVGFGSDTAGGRGGKVIKVTTLNASGPGSFREALATGSTDNATVIAVQLLEDVTTHG